MLVTRGGWGLNTLLAIKCIYTWLIARRKWMFLISLVDQAFAKIQWYFQRCILDMFHPLYLIQMIQLVILFQLVFFVMCVVYPLE